MDISDAIKLIEKAVNPHIQQTWLDLGAGDGLFTLALSNVITQPSTIVGVDVERRGTFKALSHPFHNIQFLNADFTDVRKLPAPIDGMLMANALHFVEDKLTLLRSFHSLLKPAGKLIVLEYDLEKANRWVPYPIRQNDLTSLAIKCGYANPEKLGEHKSTLNNSNIYSIALGKQ